MTIHVGEEGGRHGIEEIGEVVERSAPTGSATASSPPRDPELMARAARRRDHARDLPDLEPADEGARDEDAVRETFRAFVEHGVPFTIATDGPEMMRTHLRDEFELLLRIGALDADEARAANERGHEASFIGRRSEASANTPFGRMPAARAP